MKPKLTREEQKGETREKIISAAVEIFTENGFNEAQMKDVYEKAGIGKKTLYRYFTSKVDLALTVETRILKTMVDNVLSVNEIIEDKTISGYEKLEKIYRKGFPGVYRRYEKFFRFTAQFDVNVTGAHEDLESGRRFTGFIKNLKNFTSELIIEGQADGSVRKDINPQKTSVAGNNALMGLILRVFTREENLIREQGFGRVMIEWYIDMFLDYIKVR